MSDSDSAVSDFPERLAAARKERGLTQAQLAEKIAIHVVQLRRYESGSSQPTLDVIRRLAVALQVSADLLLFGHDRRGAFGNFFWVLSHIWCRVSDL